MEKDYFDMARDDEHTYQNDSASGHLPSKYERVIAVGGPIVES